MKRLLLVVALVLTACGGALPVASASQMPSAASPASSPAAPSTSPSSPSSTSSPTVAPSPSATRSWSSVAGMSSARANFTATLLPDGDVLVAGGVPDLTVSGHASATAEIFRAASRRFEPAGTMSTGRAGHTATLLLNGKVLVAGGYGALGARSLASVEIFDPATRSWSSAAPMLNARSLHAAVLLASGKVLVVGCSAVPPVGISPHGAAPASLAPEIYDPAADTWTAAAMPALDRPVEPTATLLSDGRVLVAGGQYMWNSADESTEKSEVYDPAANRWSSVSVDVRFQARQYQTATRLSNGSVLVAGGMIDLQPTSTAALYDPTTNSWTELPNMTIARCGQGAAPLLHGRVLLVASGCWNQYAAGVDEFDPGTMRWNAVEDLPHAGGRLQAVGLAVGTVLAVGGTDGAYPTASAEIFQEA